MFVLCSGSCLFYLVNLFFPLDFSNVESIFLEALALEGPLRPKAPAAAALFQSKADGDHTARALPPPRSDSRWAYFWGTRVLYAIFPTL